MTTPRVQKNASKPVMPTPLTTQDTPVVTTFMKTRSQGEADLMDDFLINRAPRQPATVIKKVVSGHVTKSWKLLQRMATAPGQRRVSDFYYIDPNNVSNENYLPDLVRSKETPVVILISDDSDENYGPVDVSLPASHTQVFEHPNLSLIHSDDECIVIHDSGWQG